MIKAIVFDFDGVILESADIKTEAFVELFADRPEHQEAVRAHHLKNLGVSRFEKFTWIYANLLHEPLDETASQALGERFSALVFEKVLMCPFVPGAQEALDTLRGQLPLYIASGTPHGELTTIVERRGLAGYFLGVNGSPRKKADVILEVAERHGCAPSEVLMVGDGETDYRAAQAAGARFFARRTPDHQAFWAAQAVEGADNLDGFCQALGLA